MNKLAETSRFTELGLILSFFGPPLLLLPFQLLAPEPLTDSIVLVRELSFFLLAGVLILIIVKGEKLDIQSIGIHNRHWGKSILWSLFLLLMFFAVVAGCLGLFQLTGISFGRGDGKYAHISPWVLTIVMGRAGIVEELFYRGYVMERLHKIADNWIVYLLTPSLIFGLLHYRQGIGGIIIATATGILFSYFYWRKRDLKINIIAHFLADFIPNVLLPMINNAF